MELKSSLSSVDMAAVTVVVTVAATAAVVTAAVTPEAHAESRHLSISATITSAMLEAIGALSDVIVITATATTVADPTLMELPHHG